MKNNYSREWLENYKTIPKRDNAIYKNYQNPGMSTWDRQMASLSAAQRNRYNEFLNTIPNELQGLSAAEMQKYLQEINQKQNALTQEKASYENQVQNIKNQEAQRQAQLRAKPEMSQWMKDKLLNAKYSSETNGWGFGPNQFGNGIIGKPYHQVFFRDIAPLIRNEMNSGLSYKEALQRVTSPYDWQNQNKPSNKYLGRFTHNASAYYNSHKDPWRIAARGATDPLFHVINFLQSGINGIPAIEGNDPGEEGYKYLMNRWQI